MADRSLIIVESPSKARTIERYLGKRYRVLACNGHIKDLPKKELGIDITDNFKARYVILPEKYKIIRKLKEGARQATAIFIATDPDREGEAIAWHIATELDGNSKKIRRVLFNEITAGGIRAGMEHPKEVDRNLVNAQQARRIIDRLVGFKVSEFLWAVLFGGLSAGRVQSVALRLVCERHAEITAFRPKEYWTLAVELKTEKGEIFTAQLYRVKGEKPTIPNKDEAQKIMDRLENAVFTISSVRKKEVRRNPYPPFVTSTLQQEAASRLRFSPTKTMRIAQKLYEGVDMGHGRPTGLITYMRTDSTRISSEAIKSVRGVISSQLGNRYLPQKPWNYARKKKLVQDAHEAIRPTDPALTPDRLDGTLEKDQLRLYRLVWQRFVACQMKPMVLDQTTIDIEAGTYYLFRTQGATVKFDGFRKIYPATEKKKIPVIPKKISEKETVEKIQFLPEQHFTKPPSYFTESSLIKELDSRGIGRPSTFADIVSRLYKREYVRREKGRLIPTETGIIVNGILVENLPDIFDVGFTARMEEELDEIEAGKEDYLNVLHHFYRPFSASMELVRQRRKEIRSALRETTDELCEKCGSPMVIKWSRRGQKFLGCSAFPECRNTKPLSGNEQQFESLEKSCPKCGAPLLIKTGRFGRYVGCSNYPDCRHTEPLTTGVACPKTGCGGEIVERTSKKKKTFYGCSRYPECDYVSWRRPVAHHCQQCGNYFVEQYVTKKGETYYVCPQCKSKHAKLEVK